MLSDSGAPVEIANAFGYNQRSEVTEATMGTNSYVYAYDPIGNRLTAAANVATNVYASNPLNQYTNISGGSASSPTYDADGNMLTCALPTGEWRFFWDGENRLVCASNAATLVRNTYDSQSRRIRKEVLAFSESTGNFEPVTCNTFLWDNWNVIREVRSRSSEVSTNYYTWGVDLSGSLQGAGGVGGLLSVTTTDANSGTSTNYYPCYDANGKVTAYLDADGSVVAAFEYDAFGNSKSETVAAGLHLPFRFSTKYWDEETGSFYYGYRFYRPDLGRWASRDPIGEMGGNNLYQVCGNDCVGGVDYRGLLEVDDNGAHPERIVPIWVDRLTFSGLKERSKNGMPSLGLTIRDSYFVVCSCNCDKETKKNVVSCSVSWNDTIFLNKDDLAVDKEGNPSEDMIGAYGHEQKHIQARRDQIEQNISAPLRNMPSVWGPLARDVNQCRAAARSYQTLYQKELTKIYLAEEQHGVNGHPGEYDRLTPLPNSVWPPKTRKKK